MLIMYPNATIMLNVIKTIKNLVQKHLKLAKSIQKYFYISSLSIKFNNVYTLSIGPNYSIY